MEEKKLDRNKKIYVAGHRGLVGSAFVRKLKEEGFSHILTIDHKDLDLTRQQQVEEFFAKEQPAYVILAAAKVGGIYANQTYPLEFLMENLQIQCNVIKAAYENKVEKLLFLGSSCIYPRECDQPIKEEYLLGGYPEQTNEGYALAKIAGLKLCEYYRKEYGADFISAMPCNLYGIGDNFSLETSHVLPALLRKFHEAKVKGEKQVIVWGTGEPLREFLSSDHLAEAGLFLLEHYSGEGFINVGTGKEISIRELVQLITEITGYEGEVVWDSSKPDGTMRKLLDISKIRELGWEPSESLKEGIRKTYEWYCSNREAILEREENM